MTNGPLRVGIGGPVGAGKTTLTEQLCRQLGNRISMAVVTNDIYTQEDADYLMRKQVLASERIRGVETGGCPHAAIREDCSINLAAIDNLNAEFTDLELVLIESGGDNLSATFSPELADLTIYLIDVCMGEEIPRKGGPAITKSDLLVINKSELAQYVEVDTSIMLSDAKIKRGDKPTVLANLKTGRGIEEIILVLERLGGLISPRASQKS